MSGRLLVLMHFGITLAMIFHCNNQLTLLAVANAKQNYAFGGHQQGCGGDVHGMKYFMEIKYLSMPLQSLL